MKLKKPGLSIYFVDRPPARHPFRYIYLFQLTHTLCVTLFSLI